MRAVPANSPRGFANTKGLSPKHNPGATAALGFRVKETSMDRYYTYRCTNDKLPQHLERIYESGDSVMFGSLAGRDWTLVCRRGGED